MNGTAIDSEGAVSIGSSNFIAGRGVVAENWESCEESCENVKNIIYMLRDILK